MRLTPEQFWTYSEWLFDNWGLLTGLLLVIVLAVIGFLVGFVVSMVKRGPGEGFLHVAKIIRELFAVDLPKTSIQRVYAIASLAVKEAIRKKILVVVAVFVIAIMFAGWYLDPKSDNPAQLYISFVMFWTNILMLILGLFVSCFSLPADIKSRTIYTIVTKPVRATELFFGRVFGFVAVGTVILFLLGTMSYLFVVRGLNHTHEIEELAPNGASGLTVTERFHQHTFLIEENGTGATNVVKGHRHEVVKQGDKIVLGPPVDDLTARVPVYGRLRFTGRDGEENEGYNVGYMSEYQKYIEGDTLSSAIWKFKDVRPSSSDQTALNYDLTLSAFRTYKGDIVTPVGGVVVFRSTDGTVESERFSFKVKEFQIDQRSIPLKLKGFRNGEPTDLDFFKDIAPDGSFEIMIRCLDRNQYLGMAAADVYLRRDTKSFWQNFVKGYISIWLQMVIVICFGVMFSCFLSGQVALIATVSFLVLGFFGSFVDNVLSKKIEGGGPIESLIKIPLGSSSTIDLDLGSPVMENVIRSSDRGLLICVKTLKDAIPNFNQLGTSDFVAYGVDLSSGLLARHLTICFGYFLMTSLISYFFLKTREMAA
jgi:ABC-type transport system involved in multi-copper enzyme maturation permease subunit